MKAIPGYPCYFADQYGIIYSIRSGSIRKLIQRVHKGYFHVYVRTGTGRETQKKEPVHKLMLLTYYGPREEGMVCRHLNGKSLDNRLSNLCWGTPKENAQDSIRHGTAICLRHGEEHVASKLKTKDVFDIKRLVKTGVRRSEVAALYKITVRHVGDIVNGKTWVHLNEA